jgi:hypothetical protein
MRGTLWHYLHCPFSTEISRECSMSFPWPVADDEPALNDALDIALRYFELPHDEEEYSGVESFAGQTIMAELRRGQRNTVVLANKAIAELEEHHAVGNRLRRAS